ncbi:transposase [Nonomuraea dietziae]|uniref:transposase n=1 Tax=Nonomuraea dietziae TaxID=65515 RepID=UPI0033F11AB3
MHIPGLKRPHHLDAFRRVSAGSDVAPSPLTSAGRPPEHDLRDILYLNRAGIAWRYLPHDYAPWQTAYAYFARWQKDGIFDQLTSLLRRFVRTPAGRDPDPSRVNHRRKTIKAVMHLAMIDRMTRHLTGENTPNLARHMTPRPDRTKRPIRNLGLFRTTSARHTGTTEFAELCKLAALGNGSALEDPPALRYQYVVDDVASGRDPRRRGEVATTWARIVAAVDSGEALQELLTRPGDGARDIGAYYIVEGFSGPLGDQGGLLLTTVMSWTPRELQAQTGTRTAAIGIIRDVLLVLAENRNSRSSKSSILEGEISKSRKPLQHLPEGVGLDSFSAPNIRSSRKRRGHQKHHTAAPAVESEGEILNRVFSALADAGHPLEASLLAEKIDNALSPVALKRKIGSDARFSRSDVEMWGLAEWGMPVYKPIKELVADLMEKHGGTISSDMAIRVLARDFSIKESSLRQVMSSPPFTVRNGMVHLLADMTERAGDDLNIMGHANSSDHEAGPSADDLIRLMDL